MPNKKKSHPNDLGLINLISFFSVLQNLKEKRKYKVSYHVLEKKKGQISNKIIHTMIVYERNTCYSI